MFTGVSDPYEEPEQPEVTVETNALSVDQCCQAILETAFLSGYIDSAKQVPFSGYGADDHTI